MSLILCLYSGIKSDTLLNQQHQSIDDQSALQKHRFNIPNLSSSSLTVPGRRQYKLYKFFFESVRVPRKLFSSSLY